MTWGSIKITTPDTPIKARRIELGLSRMECARRYARVMGREPVSKPSRTHWNYIERTNLKHSKPETKQAVAEVLETTVEELTKGQDQ